MIELGVRMTCDMCLRQAAPTWLIGGEKQRGRATELLITVMARAVLETPGWQEVPADGRRKMLVCPGCARSLGLEAEPEPISLTWR